MPDEKWANFAGWGAHGGLKWHSLTKKRNVKRKTLNVKHQKKLF
jgi:hypothetical protein